MKKFVFYALIVILALSMSLPFLSNMNLNQSKQTPATQSKPDNSAPQGLEGVVRKNDAGKFAKGSHVLEVSGISLAALDADKGVNLDNYIGQDVKISGTPEALEGGNGIYVKVSKVEEVKK